MPAGKSYKFPMKGKGVWDNFQPGRCLAGTGEDKSRVSHEAKCKNYDVLTSKAWGLLMLELKFLHQ